MMKTIFLSSLTAISLLLAVKTQATVNADTAANYEAGWTSGSNGGGGFGAWSIATTAGAGWATNGIWASADADLSMGRVFGFTACGDNSAIYLDRPFLQAMNTNDVFTLDFGLNYDAGTGGNKGFSLRTADNRVIVTVNQADSPAITLNGTTTLTNAGTTAMHWTFTQKTATQIQVYATGRSGSEAYAVILTNTQASYIAGVQFYATAITNDESAALRAVYFDNLILSQTAGTNTFAYTIDNSRAIITGIASNTTGAVVIPATLGGYPVTEIGRSAFKDCTNLTSISFASGGSVTNIGATAFQGCSGLLLVVLPTGLTALPAGLFYGCTELVSVAIPAGITNIGEAAFAGCRKLASPALPAGLSGLGESAFLNCRKLTALAFPAKVTTIPGQFNYECRGLTAVNLSTGITNIGYSAFYNCLGLETLSFPTSLAALEHDAFHGCSQLKTLTFNSALNQVGERAFYDCATLSTLYFYGSVGNLGAGAFGNSPALSGVYFVGAMPALGTDNGTNVFANDNQATVYYLASAGIWSTSFCGVAATAWLPVVGDLTAANGMLGFSIAWATGQIIRVQACTNLASPTWADVYTNTIAGGTCAFSDFDWTAYEHRYYRIVGGN